MSEQGSRTRQVLGRLGRSRRAVAFALGLALAGTFAATALPASATIVPAAVVTGGWSIDGQVPDAGTAQFSDPHDSSSELGPKNGSPQQLGVINKAAPAMLELTNPNAQVDLVNSWLGTKVDPVTSDVWLYAAWQRDSSNGSGVIMYEFEKSGKPVTCNYGTGTNAQLIGACNPWAGRQPGDFLIVWDQSGNKPVIAKRTFTTVAGKLVLGPGVSLSGTDVNAAYDSTGKYGEMAIDLTNSVFAGLPAQCLTLANVIPMTVTGNSDTADVKDTILADTSGVYISNCGSVQVTKVTNPVGQAGPFPVTLSRVGGGDVRYPAGTTSAGDSLAGDGSVVSLQDVRGATDYRLEETLPAGWDRVSLTCAPPASTAGSGAAQTAVGAGGFPVSNGQVTECTLTNLLRSPALSLAKTASPKTYDHLNEAIGYSYLVTNTGNVPLAGPVTVADDKTTVTCPPLPAGGLAVGATTTCTASYSVTQADLDAVSVTNLATATANGTSSNQATATVTSQAVAALSLDKTASVATYKAVGDHITYSYLVTNTGQRTLAGPVTVADDKLATVTCPSGGLAPGASTTCTATATVTQAELDFGSITNVAVASAGGVKSNPDTQVVNAVASRTLTLDKTASASTYKAVGDQVTYSYLVTNTGNVTLAGPVTVADDKLAAVTCPTGDLAAGASTTCTATATVAQSDLDFGSITNTARASAGGVKSNPDTVVVKAVQTRALLLAKRATPATYDHVGAKISYSYDVTNTGNVTLAGPVTVADDKASVTCPALPAGGLAPKAKTTCTSSYTVTQADLDAGSVTNLATATANGVTSNQAKATVTAVAKPALAVTKSAQQSRYDVVGDVIDYSYVVTNTGNVTLAGPVTVVDDRTPTSCPSVAPLAPGASMTCTASYTATQADVDAGSVTNTAYATNGPVKSSPVQVTVPGQQVRSVGLVKQALQTTYNAVGQSIGYTYAVTNTGNTTLAGPVTVADDKTAVTCPTTASLAPKASVTCTASYSVTQADLDAGSVVNTAVATVGTVTSDPAKATVPAAQAPALSLTKTPAPVTFTALGDVITYTYVAKNVGNTTLSGPFTVKDDKTPVTCPAVATLAPGSTLTCSARYSVTQADLDARQVVNTATVTNGTVTSPPVTARVTRTEVLGEVQTVPPATPAPTASPLVLPFADPVKPATLPFTGVQLMPLLALGVAGLLFGALITAASRRRREQG